MTRIEVIAAISKETKTDKETTGAILAQFFETVQTTLESGDGVFIRGFGAFILKKRAEKTGRDIARNTAVIIPEHVIPAFKPGSEFTKAVKAVKPARH